MWVVRAEVNSATSACKVCAMPDSKGLPNPFGELVIELGMLPDPVMVHEQPLGVRRHGPDPRVYDLTLEVQVANQTSIVRPRASKAATIALESDRAPGWPPRPGAGCLLAGVGSLWRGQDRAGVNDPGLSLG